MLELRQAHPALQHGEEDGPVEGLRAEADVTDLQYGERALHRLGLTPEDEAGILGELGPVVGEEGPNRRVVPLLRVQPHVLEVVDVPLDDVEDVESGPIIRVLLAVDELVGRHAGEPAALLGHPPHPDVESDAVIPGGGLPHPREPVIDGPPALPLFVPHIHRQWGAHTYI